ncbi:transporter substrate-binding domain-containing protein [Terasakiella sp. A23]|uniref:transporter substrate-binding domain-containing protein n=1 Tax=Terasakiella sp. FCG-A23 TaxID=3080561 RepID=UPI0029532C66|nr:transporter substrate-binding domain-containing protein [Terasakiella sp. A23]MDV7341252.1 transporter substrate-binding domain-containing protein [Terasakiella sp. A23]
MRVSHLFLLLFILVSVDVQAGTLDRIKTKGVVTCGAGTTPGFASNDADGKPVGLMVDLCRALAAAVFNDANSIQIVSSTKSLEFQALEEGSVDVSFAQTTWTLSRDVQFQIDFGPVIFFDGQAIAIRNNDQQYSRPTEIKSGKVCVIEGSTSERNIKNFIGTNRLDWQVVTYQSRAETLQGFLGKACDMITSDMSILKASLMDISNEITIFPQTFSREPIAPVISNEDRNWLAVVRWVHYALFLAEEKGLTSQNVAEMRESGDREIQRLLKGNESFSKKTGLSMNWASQVISSVGNYGEIFERNIGENTPYKFPRTANKPWTEGGAFYAPVFQ